MLRGGSEDGTRERFEEPLVLDDVKAYSHAKSNDAGETPTNMERTQSPGSRRFEATPVAVPTGVVGNDQASDGPHFPRAASRPAEQRNAGAPPATPPQPRRPAWLTGTIEDPDRDIAQVRAISHGESAPRADRGDASPRPPHRYQRR